MSPVVVITVLLVCGRLLMSLGAVALRLRLLARSAVVNGEVKLGRRRYLIVTDDGERNA